MDTTLPNQVVIENVLVSKIRGKIAYQGNISASTIMGLYYVKPYDDPSGKGYQRPVDQKRSHDFAIYLSKGEDALFTPILLNAASKWEFVCYDRARPAYGRLICKGKASLMDGQHRLGGIKRYIQETNSDLNIPFLSFHYLDEDEEIRLFDTINTKAKGIGSSLSKYLRRDSDELSWVATQLLIQSGSPFHNNGSILGKRNKSRHITLQNLYRTLSLLFKNQKLSVFTKEEKLSLATFYFSTMKELFPSEWMDYKGQRLTHIVCLDALSIAGSQVLVTCIQEPRKQVDLTSAARHIKKLKGIEWSSEGPLKYVKGLSGSRTLASELLEQMIG
ncbi:DGQHR domain-containing protein [Brevibacillus antibioticus]|uniref:DGQHR domain-containing protein n=1 Tax=Brevibacillus antibioticus TaxID=2570228 RepID=A0A4U2Y537_9BACL|nr:DGQHR domain-containing protein [Brevibacillus antibioticus]TKI54812.1 DGQHR domain-containing protein [Brevibacillus antibioticus]